MTQWLRALAAFAEGLGSNPSIRMAAHHHLHEELMPFSDPEGTKHTPGAHKLKQNTNTLKTNKTTLKKCPSWDCGILFARRRRILFLPLHMPVYIDLRCPSA